MARFRICPLCFALAALGALAMLAGAVFDINHPAFRFGLAVFLIGATGAVVSRTAATNGAIEAARQAAYRSGYDDGRRVAHPVVVPIRRVLEPVGSAQQAAPHLAPHAEGLGAG